MKRYAILNEGLYWTGPRVCWCAALPDAADLLTRDGADRELARLKGALPHEAGSMTIVDVTDIRARSAICGAAFRAAIAGKDRTEANLDAAHSAGMDALRLAGAQARDA